MNLHGPQNLAKSKNTCYFDSLEKLIKRTEGENLHLKHFLNIKTTHLESTTVIFDYRTYKQFRFLNVTALIYFFFLRKREVIQKGLLCLFY